MKDATSTNGGLDMKNYFEVKKNLVLTGNSRIFNNWAEHSSITATASRERGEREVKITGGERRVKLLGAHAHQHPSVRQPQQGHRLHDRGTAAEPGPSDPQEFPA